MWARRTDRVIVAEVPKVYAPIDVRPDDVLLDLGAHIGLASRFLLDKGVAQVVAVEPDPANVILLRRNLRRRPATVIWAAVGAKPGRITLYSAGSHLSTTLPGKGRTKMSVPVVALSSLLSTVRPTILKCDIEFGEYSLPELRSLPERVRVLALEVHVRLDLVYSKVRESETQVRERRATAASLITAIEAQGFRRLGWSQKQARDGAVEDETGLHPLCKSVDAVWSR